MLDFFRPAHGAALSTRGSPLPLIDTGEDLAPTLASSARKAPDLTCGDASALTGEALENAQYAAAGVINLGRQTPLSPDDMCEARSCISQAVNASHSHIGDTDTLVAVEQTLQDALTLSWTFQCALGYGIEKNCASLEDMVFMDRNRSATPSDGDPCTAGAPPHDKKAWALTDLDTSPVSRPDDGEWLTIYVSAPPVGDKSERDAWKAALIHQVLCVVTGAAPSGSSPAQADGARILTKAVALEMAWQLPEHLASLELPDQRLVRFDKRFATPHGPESALSRVARQIETMGSWDGQHGDIVPAVMRHIFPNLELRILSESMPAQTFVDKQVPAAQRKPVTLSLRHDHYVLGDAAQPLYNPPADGNCFYNSLLYGVHGRLPTRQDVQALRDRVSLAIQTHHRQFAPFLQMASSAQ